jgi:hypothetical protein
VEARPEVATDSSSGRSRTGRCRFDESPFWPESFWANFFIYNDKMWMVDQSLNIW